MTHYNLFISKGTLLFIVFLLSGCDIFQSDVNEHIAEPSEIYDEGMTIRFFEHSSDADLRLIMQTKGEFSYYSIDFEVVDHHINSTFTREIIINGILDRPEFRPSTPNVATSHISFSGLEGELNLLIRDGPYTDSFKTHITEERVDITPHEVTFTEIIYERYYRRPPNSLFFSCSTIEAKKELCRELHELFEAEANLHEFTFPDDGKMPYPEKEKTWDFEFSAPIRYYIYESIEDFRHAGQLLSDFADENNIKNEDNWLYIVNWKEVAYSSYFMIY